MFIRERGEEEIRINLSDYNLYYSLSFRKYDGVMLTISIVIIVLRRTWVLEVTLIRGWRSFVFLSSMNRSYHYGKKITHNLGRLYRLHILAVHHGVLK